jgi:hypothetical protein
MDNQGLNFRIININEKINIPEFRESGYKDWIEYGIDNLFPQFLVDVYHMKSITHKTIINRKVKMIVGGGFEKSDNPEINNFISNRFNDNDDLNDVLIKVAYDLEIHGGFSLNVRWDQLGNKISEINHIPYETLRVSKNNGSNGLPDYYWHSNDWSNIRRFTPRKAQGFSTKYKENKSQILYKSEFMPGARMFYPIPMYYSSINWILAEWEISNFHRATIQNGFNAGFILNFATGVPTPEEMEIAYREIREKYTGTWNAGKFILTFSNGKDEAPHLEPIPLADTDARYKELNDLIRQNIFTANEVTTPDLFGVSTPGQLGTRDQLFEGLEVFQSVYINYKQRLIEREFNRLLSASGIVGELKIKKYEIDLQKIGQ